MVVLLDKSINSNDYFDPKSTKFHKAFTTSTLHSKGIIWPNIRTSLLLLHTTTLTNSKYHRSLSQINVITDVLPQMSGYSQLIDHRECSSSKINFCTCFK
ncbi:hypothetical protein quinque_013695 [Culex quinquefasciatus]